MDHNEAEDILNNADLRKRSYTENLALLNYQMTEIRGDQKEYLRHQKEMNEKLWKGIEGNADAITENEKDIIRLEKDQSVWNKGLAVLSTITLGIASYFGVKR